MRGKATKSMDLLSLKRAFVRYVSHEIRYVLYVCIHDDCVAAHIMHYSMPFAAMAIFLIVLLWTKVPFKRRPLWYRFSSGRDSAEHVVRGERRGDAVSPPASPLYTYWTIFWSTKSLMQVVLCYIQYYTVRRSTITCILVASNTTHMSWRTSI